MNRYNQKLENLIGKQVSIEWKKSGEHDVGILDHHEGLPVYQLLTKDKTILFYKSHVKRVKIPRTVNYKDEV